MVAERKESAFAQYVAAARGGGDAAEVRRAFSKVVERSDDSVVVSMTTKPTKPKPKAASAASKKAAATRAKALALREREAAHGFGNGSGAGGALGALGALGVGGREAEQAKAADSKAQAAVSIKVGGLSGSRPGTGVARGGSSAGVAPFGGPSVSGAARPSTGASSASKASGVRFRPVGPILAAEPPRPGTSAYARLEASLAPAPLASLHGAGGSRPATGEVEARRRAAAGRAEELRAASRGLSRGRLGSAQAAQLAAAAAGVVTSGPGGAGSGQAQVLSVVQEGEGEGEGEVNGDGTEGAAVRMARLVPTAGRPGMKNDSRPVTPARVAALERQERFVWETFRLPMYGVPSMLGRVAYSSVQAGLNDGEKSVMELNDAIAKLKDKLTQKGHSGIIRHFQNLDASGDGLLSREDFRRALSMFQLGISAQTADSLAAEIGDDLSAVSGDKMIDYGEFTEALRFGRIHYKELPPQSAEALAKAAADPLEAKPRQRVGPNPELPLGFPATHLPYGTQADTDKNTADFDQKMSSQFLLLKDAFVKYDTDESGQISFEEFYSALQALNNHLSDDEIASMFRQADGDKSGEIDYQEFINEFGGFSMGGAGGKRFVPEFLKPKSHRKSVAGNLWDWKPGSVPPEM